jgi:hypothetical protein
MKYFLALAAILFLAGCGDTPLDVPERNLLWDITQKFETLADRHPELEGFASGKEKGVNYVSYSRDLAGKSSVPLMNPNYFWVKVSLTKKPIDPIDLQPPIVTIFMPRFKKYLKLRMATENERLMADLTKAFYETAMASGGVNPLWGDENRSKSPIRGRSRRALAG